MILFFRWRKATLKGRQLYPERNTKYSLEDKPYKTITPKNTTTHKRPKPTIEDSLREKTRTKRRQSQREVIP